MWMQQSMESSSFGNSHERNRFGQGSSGSFESSRGGHSMGNGAGASSYMGGASGAAGPNSADWKSKILESGQWLGGKVIEYGGKLARGGSHDTIPDHMASHPRNDGRANWMADIRGSASSFGNNDSYSSGGNGSTYQNDFATERPKAYSDTGYSQSTASYSSKSPAASYSDHRYNDKDSSHHHSSTSKTKKKVEKHSKHAKKNGKSKKHSKRRDVSSSDESQSESESESESASSSLSASDSESDHRRSKNKSSKSTSKSKSKNKSKKIQKRRESFSSSEEDDTLEAKPKTNKKSVAKPAKAPADYSFSFDPAKLPPPPPVEESASKKSSKKETKKSRGRRQSMASSESELSDKENQRTKKVTLKSKNSKSSKKTTSTTTPATVDLLGVEFDAVPVPVATAVPFVTSSHPPQQQAPLDIFSQPLDPLQDLAGLNFSAGYTAPQPQQLTAASHVVPSQATTVDHAVADARVLQKLLPENNIVDLNALAGGNSKASTTEKKSLNELQREQPSQLQLQQLQQQQHHALLVQQQQLMMMGGVANPALAMQQQQQQQQYLQQMQMSHMNGMMQQMHLQPQQLQLQLHQHQALYAQQNNSGSNTSTTGTGTTTATTTTGMPHFQ